MGIKYILAAKYRLLPYFLFLFINITLVIASSWQYSPTSTNIYFFENANFSFLPPYLQIVGLNVSVIESVLNTTITNVKVNNATWADNASGVNCAGMSGTTDNVCLDADSGSNPDTFTNYSKSNFTSNYQDRIAEQFNKVNLTDFFGSTQINKTIVRLNYSQQGNLTLSGVINATTLNGTLDCSNLVGGSDSNHCDDADSGSNPDTFTNYSKSNFTSNYQDRIAEQFNKNNLTTTNITIMNLSIGQNLVLGWTNLTNYPSACTSAQTITAIGDAITCSAIAITVSQISDFVQGWMDRWANEKPNYINKTTFGNDTITRLNTSQQGNLTLSGVINATYLNGTLDFANIINSPPTSNMQLNNISNTTKIENILNIISFNDSIRDAVRLNLTSGKVKADFDNLTVKNNISASNALIGSLNISNNISMSGGCRIETNATPCILMRCGGIVTATCNPP